MLPNLPEDPPSSSLTRRVLVIDDDPDILEVMGVALGAAGFTVASCPDPSVAVTCALEFQPDLIVLDAMMPGIDGPEVLRRLRAQPEISSVPVVFVTARVDSEAVHDFVQSGAAAVIGKPFDPLLIAGQLLALMEPRG